MSNPNIKIFKGQRVRHVQYAGLRGVVEDVIDNGKLTIRVRDAQGQLHDYEPAWLMPIGEEAA
jgi:hypothetical protein